MSDYIDNNGPAIIYNVWVLENGEKFFVRTSLVAQSSGDGKLTNMVADQLEVAQKMKTAKVGSLQFPPTETNVTDYFKTMKGKPISEIKDAFKNYANAFYVHSEKKGVDRGDIVYSEHKYKEGKTVYNSNAPVSCGSS